MSLSNSCSGRIGSVLVTITSLIRLFLSRSTAGAREHAVRRGDDHLGGAGVEEQVGGLGDRAAGVDHVVDQQAAPPVDVTDDPVGDDLVGGVDVARLVHERDVEAAERVGPLLGHAHPAGVGGDDEQVLVAVAVQDVPRQQRHREQVVDRPVEEALDLRGVQVDGHQPVGAGGLEQVGDQPGRDRLAAAVLLVLPAVGVERRDHGDPLGRGPLEGVDQDQGFHHPLVDRRRVGLDDERVGAAHRIVGTDEQLAVGELAPGGRGDRDPDVARRSRRRARGRRRRRAGRGSCGQQPEECSCFRVPRSRRPVPVPPPRRQECRGASSPPSLPRSAAWRGPPPLHQAGRRT